MDWQSASIGPPDIDIGHCRANLLQHGHQVIQDFTGAWERTAGLTYGPWADIGALIGNLDLSINVPDRKVSLPRSSWPPVLSNWSHLHSTNPELPTTGDVNHQVALTVKHHPAQHTDQ